ncbi:MAG: ankyrin repeat domain-containing protein [Candidatus Accumulibacter sp.]|jgi:ankyrin repeat protein|nr:ankyrin repeat domain-containing protein [Accumulibacter sp.]
MSTDPPPDLLKAIRTGQLLTVIAVLDSGAPVELDDGKGNPGLPLAIACFLGHAEIVRELILRGALVNFPDNGIPNSPLSMAVRAGRKEVIKVLIENGTLVPDGMDTGLSADELMLAYWKAQHLGNGAADPADKVFEEIQVIGCYGTDTDILDEDMRRAIESLPRKP